MTATAEQTGHVFVIKGDIKNVACDAFMWATDKRLSATGRWHTAAIGIEDRLDSTTRRAFQDESRFTLPATPRENHPNEPTPILTAVPFYGVMQAEDIRLRVREFFDAATADARERQVTQKLGERELPLMAVPLFGVGGGGGGRVRGDVFRVLYDESLRAAHEHGIDVVIVLQRARDYDLAQSIRRSMTVAWAALEPNQRAAAEQLGGEAAAHRLVPFMGSGVSASAGAPVWKKLIAGLAQEAGLDEETANDLGENHDVLDQAAYLHREFAHKSPYDSQAFARAVVKLVDVPRYGLGPALLASLDAEQAITLNYDQLFEKASDDAGLPRRVIPGPDSTPERWLLKLHGSVSDLESIILTREDYLGFSADRTALSSLVKATLMTRRLLFVGFGVRDPHFHEIVHDVRRALPGRVGPFGTVLTLEESKTTQRLWEGELEFVVLKSARLIDIFLDAVMAHAATTHSYLLADGYASTLPPADTALRNALRDFIRAVPSDAKDSSGWGVLEATLRELGWGAERG